MARRLYPGVVGETGLGGLNIISNTITTSAANDSMVLQPNGTGDVQLNADTIRIGDQDSNAVLTTWGTGDLTISTNSGSNSGTILIPDGSNASIEVTPNGSGDVRLNADTVRVGDSNGNVTITTNGTGDLTLNTNGGSNSGSIIIPDGSNQSITIEPSGTGDILLNADLIRIGDNNTNAVLTTRGTGDLTLSTNSGSNSGTIAILDGSNQPIRIYPNGSGQVNLGSATSTVVTVSGNTGATAANQGALRVTGGGSFGADIYITGDVRTSADVIASGNVYGDNITTEIVGGNITAPNGPNRVYFLRSNASRTITLPNAPTDGQRITVYDGGLQNSTGEGFSRFPCTIARNGKTIASGTSNLTLDVTGTRIDLVYYSNDWRVYAF